MKSDDALNMVRSKRGIVNPNAGFWNQLKKYQGILYQKRARGSGAQMGQQQKPMTPVNNMNYNYGNVGNQIYSQAYQPNQQIMFDPYAFGGFF